MNKYLYVEFIDNESKIAGENLGLEVPVFKRIVKIKLTEEQIKQLEPKKVGYKHEYEDMRLICIQDE